MYRKRIRTVSPAMAFTQLIHQQQVRKKCGLVAKSRSDARVYRDVSWQCQYVSLIVDAKIVRVRFRLICHKSILRLN